MASAALEFLNTTKRGPALAYRFGLVRYKSSRDQRDIPERGPRLSLGATRKVGQVTSYFVAWRNGTGRVTFLQSSDQNLSHGHFDYMTPPSEMGYAKKFKHAVDTLSSKDDYDPTLLLSEREKEVRAVHEEHGVREACKRQGDSSWLGVRPNTISGTVGHGMLPRDTSKLTRLEIELICDDLKKKLKTPAQLEVDLSWRVRHHISFLA